MKKIIYFVLLSVFLLSSFSFGCKKEVCLSDYISEARLDILCGESENYKVKTEYGYTKTNNCENYTLLLCLLNVIPSEICYSASFSINNKEYNKTFSYEPTKNTLCVKFDIEKFESKELTITIIKDSNKEDITIKSIIPENTVSPETALSSLYLEQKTYIDSLFLDGTFTANLSIRIVERKGKSYYYVGITDKNKNIKAFLIDGKTCEILAVRKVI